MSEEKTEELHNYAFYELVEDEMEFIRTYASGFFGLDDGCEF